MEAEPNGHQAQIVYFSHGGGPLPILGDPGHAAMLDFMRALPGQLKRPEAVLVISAHWEENTATLMGAARPEMFYDYYGFPEEAYQITYPAPGSPELAARVVRTLEDQRIPARIDPRRGFDHGLFIPLKMMYPQADIPSLQLSLLRGLDAGAHLALGRALRALAGENILVVGSGFSFHNMRVFMQMGLGAITRWKDPQNEAFQDWLIETCTSEMTEEDRERRLLAWEKAPAARYCHPREEHLLPLHVCQAMAGGPGRLVFDDTISGVRATAFLWG